MLKSSLRIFNIKEEFSKKKALENRYRVEMHVHSPIFSRPAHRKKKIKPITLIVWVLERVKKCLKKGKKNEKKYFFLF